MNESRPVLRLERSQLDKWLDGTCWVLLLCLWIVSILSWIYLPDSVPTHFNAAGVVDGHGSKAVVIVLPVIGSFVFTLITLLIPYPHVFNYMVKITAENATRQYRLATQMMRWIKLSVLIIFLAISLMSLLVGMGKLPGLSVWFLPATLLLIFIPTIYMVIRSLSLK